MSLQNLENKGAGEFLPRKTLHPKELDIKILHPKDLREKIATSRSVFLRLLSRTTIWH